MALPPRGTLTGDLGNALGAAPAGAGTLWLTPPTVVAYADQGYTLLPQPIAVPVDADGTLTATAVARTDLGNPAGWAYIARADVPGLPATPFAVVVVASSQDIAAGIVSKPGYPEWLPTTTPHSHDALYPSRAEVTSLIDGITGVDVSGVMVASTLAAPTSLNTLYAPGVYRLNGPKADYDGAPPIEGTTTLQGQLTVLGAPGSTWAAQDFIRYSSSMWERWWRTSSSTSGGWGRWQRAITSEAAYIQPPADVNTYRTTGIYEVRTALHAGQMSNLPVALPGTLLVTATSTQVIHQTYYANAEPIPYVRALAGVGSPTWQPWRQLLGGSGEASTVDVGLRNALLVQDWTRRMGGPTPITAKVAIALRFDHGLNNFRDTILPILRSYGWSSSQVMNSRTWARTENNQVTAAELDGWTDVEVVHHGATHDDAPTLAALEDEIVTSLAELRAQLPNHQIDGWAPPGVTGTRYMGYNGGGVQELMSTHAGHLILSHHAWASGYQSDSRHRVLDGMVRHGLSHYTMDAATLAQVQTTVNGAITAQAGLCLMLHPSLLDTTGYMTTSTLTSTLSWLRTKEQAGDIQIVTLGQLNYARKVA